MCSLPSKRVHAPSRDACACRARDVCAMGEAGDVSERESAHQDIETTIEKRGSVKRSPMTSNHSLPVGTRPSPSTTTATTLGGGSTPSLSVVGGEGKVGLAASAPRPVGRRAANVLAGCLAMEPRASRMRADNSASTPCALPGLLCTPVECGTHRREPKSLR